MFYFTEDQLDAISSWLKENGKHLTVGLDEESNKPIEMVQLYKYMLDENIRPRYNHMSYREFSFYKKVLDLREDNPAFMATFSNGRQFVWNRKLQIFTEISEECQAYSYHEFKDLVRQHLMREFGFIPTWDWKDLNNFKMLYNIVRGKLNLFAKFWF